MAPSTPSKRVSHQRKKRTRAEHVATQRRKKQDNKGTPSRKKKQHPVAVITQDDSPPVSILTPPASVSTTSTPSSNNKGVEALLIRHGMEGATKPVKIDAKNILGWFRDKADAPSKGSTDSIRRAAKNLFEVVHYSNKGSSPKDSAQQPISKRLSNVGKESTPLMIVQESIPVTGISPLRRLMLEDICILPVDDAMICVLCISDTLPFYEFNRTLRNRVDEADRLPMFYRRDDCFVQMRVKIVQNRNRSLFETSTTSTGDSVDRSLFTHLMLDHGNAQIGVEYLGVVDERWFLNIKDFFIFPECFQLWSCLSFRRDFRKILERKTNKDAWLRLFRRLALEVHGDVASTRDVCSAYDALTPRTNVNRKAAPIVPPVDVLKTLPLVFYNEDIKNLSSWCNSVIAAEVQRCYGSFISWTSSILSDDCLNELQAKTYSVCSVQLAVIIEALGYGPKMCEFRNTHRVKMYERVVMYLFFSVARVRNPKLFSMWSLIGAAVFYGSTQRASARYASVLFGHACHSSTLMRLTKPFRDANASWARVEEALKTQTVDIQFPVGTKSFYVSIYTFDNAQKSYTFKFQRNGKTSNFVKVTARLFIALWQGPWRNYVFRGDPHAAITYVRQAIPSPVGMKFKYELASMASSADVLAIVTGNPSVQAFEAAQSLQSHPWTTFTQPDFSGKRVTAYCQFVHVATKLRCLFKHLSLAKSYTFEPTETASNPFRQAFATALSVRRGCSDFLHCSSSFQRRSVLAYRGLRPKIEFLSMPILRDDERNVSLVKQASMFVETQYRRKQDVDAQDAFNEGDEDGDTVDTTNRKKASTKPSDIEKKKLIDEMLTLSCVLVETPGRELDPQLIWSIIGNVTTDLTKEDETGGDADAQDEAEAEASDDKVEVEVTTNDGDEEVEIGKKRKKLKVTKVPMSPFADADTYTKGHLKLKTQDLPTARRRKKQQEAKERKALHDNLFEFQTNIGNDFDDVMRRLKRAMVEPEKPFQGHRYAIAKKIRREE